jgi:hypothetical protein
MSIGTRVWKPALASGLLLVGCATNVRMYPVSGSRADGVIVMAVDVGEFQKPVINWEEARSTAANRCVVWGYSSAEAFGSVERRCVSVTNLGGCVTYRYTANFQCSGGH